MDKIALCRPRDVCDRSCVLYTDCRMNLLIHNKLRNEINTMQMLLRCYSFMRKHTQNVHIHKLKWPNIHSYLCKHIWYIYINIISISVCTKRRQTCAWCESMASAESFAIGRATLSPKKSSEIFAKRARNHCCRVVAVSASFVHILSASSLAKGFSLDSRDCWSPKKYLKC